MPRPGAGGSLRSSPTSRCASAASVTACTCSIRSRAARSASKSRACSIASAARSPTSCSSSTSSSWKARGRREPTWRTPRISPSNDERHAEHRLDSLLAQERVEDVSVVDVVEDHRPLLGGDPPCEASRRPGRGRPAPAPPRCRARRGRRARSSPRRGGGSRTCRPRGSGASRSSSAASSSSRRRWASAASVTDCSRRTCSEVEPSDHTTPGYSRKAGKAKRSRALRSRSCGGRAPSR